MSMNLLPFVMLLTLSACIFTMNTSKQSAPIISLPKTLYRFKNNQSGTITCVVNANPPVTHYIWIKNKQILNMNSERLQKTLRNGVMSLFIRNVQKTDKGIYICSASNSVGETWSGIIHVYVQYLPEVEVVPTTLVLGKDEGTTLFCFVDAYPPAKLIVWYTEKQNGKKQILKVLRLADSNSGVGSLYVNKTGHYFCEVFNINGTGLGKADALVEKLKPLSKDISSTTALNSAIPFIIFLLILSLLHVPFVRDILFPETSVKPEIQEYQSRTSSLSPTI